ncbi:hypothetical protein RchiOBHm_Chr3g0487261 [Rosa chinensis]|uniref:Uncharacterized protein n=1 Tax=Rosa chinensis TaxID=74649 RepID=A0A2P6RFG6_ROSCH|nr:hypothetical protein RchiOBHm_Chr3g0487261 [Rosa chinensis]
MMVERSGAGLIGFILNPTWSAAVHVWLLLEAVLGHHDRVSCFRAYRLLAIVEQMGGDSKW